MTPSPLMVKLTVKKMFFYFFPCLVKNKWIFLILMIEGETPISADIICGQPQISCWSSGMQKLQFCWGTFSLKYPWTHHTSLNPFTIRSYGISRQDWLARTHRKISLATRMLREMYVWTCVHLDMGLCPWKVGVNFKKAKISLVMEHSALHFVQKNQE